MATDLQRSAPRVHFISTAGGAGSPKWQGRCPACEAWSSLSEAAVRLTGRGAPRVAAAASTPMEVVMAAPARLGPSGSFELDRVLGGGIVPGSVVLLGGDPGIGKSTLALQVTHACGDQASPALYCSGEESLEQLALCGPGLGGGAVRARLVVGCR